MMNQDSLWVHCKRIHNGNRPLFLCGPQGILEVLISLRSPWRGELVFSCWGERRGGGLACPGSPFESV